jgi:hypothetical protein
MADAHDIESHAYTITEVVADSTHRFFEGFVIAEERTEGVGGGGHRFFEGIVITDDRPYSDGQTKTIVHKFPTPYVGGYYDSRYNGDGYLESGRFEAEYPMYFLGKPHPKHVAPGVSGKHGEGYPDAAPGAMPVKDLPFDTDPDGGVRYYFTISVEHIDALFQITPDAAEGGKAIPRHTVTYQ